MNYIDLFAGAGGLSEGFTRSGYNAIAHVEMNADACKTIKTRIAYHTVDPKIYKSYLKGRITNDQLWASCNADDIASVINKEISDDTIGSIMTQIDELRDSKKVDLIIGGPPCQAYSLVGRSRDPNKMQGDKRNYLFKYYAEFLRRFKPEYFVFENVLGLLTAGNAKYLTEMVELFGELGYQVAAPTVLNAEDYGVIQKRRRVIIIGRRGKSKFEFPEIEKLQLNLQTRRDIFSDLPYLQQGQEIKVGEYIAKTNKYLTTTGIRDSSSIVTQQITRGHNDRDLDIYGIAINKWVDERVRLKYNDVPKKLQTHNNQVAFLDRYKVVHDGGFSHTMVAHIAKDGHYYIYPDKSNIRSLSVREAARIQSFPDNYYFEGGRTAAFKQIGNAVPPLMAEALAKTINSL